MRRNKHMFGNKSDDVQLSSQPSNNNLSTSSSYSGQAPDVMKSSLLGDISNSSSTPYDMTLIDLDESSYPAKVPAADKSSTR